MEGTRRPGMEQQKAAPTLVYFHIPKCAGSTVMSLLRANYGAGFHRVGNGGGWRKFHKRPAEQRNRITCLTGHLPWGVQIGTIPRPYQTAMMLRHPVDRVVSLYWFVRRFPKHKWYEFARQRGLVAFATSGAFADVDNGMTRWLAGCKDCGSLPIKRQLTEDHFGLALLHLQTMAAVGFVASFDASVQRFAKAFRWEHTDYTTKMVGKRHRAATDKERQAIAEYNHFDMAIYEHALRTAE